MSEINSGNKNEVSGEGNEVKNVESAQKTETTGGKASLETKADTKKEAEETGGFHDESPEENEEINEEENPEDSTETDSENEDSPEDEETNDEDKIGFKDDEIDNEKEDDKEKDNNDEVKENDNHEKDEEKDNDNGVDAGDKENTEDNADAEDIEEKETEKAEEESETEEKDKDLETSIDDKVEDISDDDTDITDDEKAKLSSTFKDGKYRTVRTKEDITLYRVYGTHETIERDDKGNPVLDENGNTRKVTHGSFKEGTFLTDELPTDRMTSKMDSALDTRYKNTMEHYCEVNVPKGTVLRVGTVGEQHTPGGQELPGGAKQFVTEKSFADDPSHYGEEKDLDYKTNYHEFNQKAEALEKSANDERTEAALDKSDRKDILEEDPGEIENYDDNNKDENEDV